MNGRVTLVYSMLYNITYTLYSIIYTMLYTMDTCFMARVLNYVRYYVIWYIFTRFSLVGLAFPEPRSWNKSSFVGSTWCLDSKWPPNERANSNARITRYLSSNSASACAVWSIPDLEWERSGASQSWNFLKFNLDSETVGLRRYIARWAKKSEFVVTRIVTEAQCQDVNIKNSEILRHKCWNIALMN